MKSADILDEVKRLQPFSEEPLRASMSRGVQFPTVGARVLSLEQDLNRTRAALRDALALLRTCAAAEPAPEERDSGKPRTGW